MRKFLASGMFIFLALFANLTAEHNHDKLNEYLKERICWLNVQLDDQSLDQNCEYAIFLLGEREIYTNILTMINS